MQGGLELAFMSTTTAKKEAMAYARRAPGMILFEIQQGFVARGASISWLSQYPDEEEILFPPLTALEVCGTKVEGAVLIVQLRPSMKAPKLKTGTQDIEESQRMREEKARLIAEAQQRHEDEKKRGTAALALKQRQMAWQQSMMDVRLAASQRSRAAAQKKLAEEKKVSLAKMLESAVDRTQKKELAEKLRSVEEEIQAVAKMQKEAEEKAEKATASEQKALDAKKQAEHKLGISNWKISAMYSEAQFLRGVLRAKELAKLKSEQDGDPIEEAPPERVRIDYGPLGDITADVAVQKLAEVVGEPDSWPIRGIQPEDVEFMHTCCDKIIMLSSGKKARKAAAQAGIFEQLGKVMKRYESDNHLLLKCLQVLAACSKKAETDKIQPEAAACLVSLTESMETLLQDAYSTIRGITRNHRENTIKFVRTGGRVEHLDPDSNVVPPEQAPTLSRNSTIRPG